MKIIKSPRRVSGFSNGLKLNTKRFGCCDIQIAVAPAIRIHTSDSNYNSPNFYKEYRLQITISSYYHEVMKYNNYNIFCAV